MKFELTDSPETRDLDVVSRGLAAFNDADTGIADRRLLAIFARDEDGAVVGGLSGYTAWGWLFTQWLWLDESQRGQGMAAKLLAMAETEAVARGCNGAWIDTFNPVALKVYRSAGYEVFGELPEFPRGRSRYFLKKTLP